MTSKGTTTSIGAKRHFLTIQRAIETRGADGAVLKEWVAVKQVAGSIEPVTGGESFIAEGTSASVQYVIATRPTTGIEPSMRAVLGTRIFEILAVMNVEERNREMKLLCTE